MIQESRGNLRRPRLHAIRTDSPTLAANYWRRGHTHVCGPGVRDRRHSTRGELRTRVAVPRDYSHAMAEAPAKPTVGSTSADARASELLIENRTFDEIALGDSAAI